MCATVWHLLSALKPDTDTKFGLVVLNMPLEPQMPLLKLLWKKAVIKATADGGTNELYSNTQGCREHFLPDLITGDFDSIQAEVKQFYLDKGVECVSTPDQNLTDFTKCLQTLQEKITLNKLQIDCLMVLGAFDGRLDQIFSNLDTLFTARTIFQSTPVYLLNHHSVACLLPKGQHSLVVDSGYEGDWCGLIPLQGSCDHVTTTGLKWNLDNQKLKFGELISTSNTFKGSSAVTIDTDGYLLWTMGVRSL